MILADSRHSIRQATLADALSIAQVHVGSWQAAYRGLIDERFLATISVERRREMWDDSLRRDVSKIIVAERDSSVVGFCCFGSSQDDDVDSTTVGKIFCLYVLQEHWSTGLGFALSDEALRAQEAAGYRALSLWVLDTNLRARAFYERIGFQTDGKSKTEQLEDGIMLDELRYRRPI